MRPVCFSAMFLFACSSVETVSSAEEGAVIERTIPLPVQFDGHLSYQQAGTPRGHRVILLHGTPGSKKAWKSYMENVPPHREYIAIDRPAFGDSGPHTVISIWDQAKILEPFLVPQSPILVGHSYGGTLAAVMAALYPDKIAGIVIIAGSVSPDLDKQKPLFRFFHPRPWRWLVPRGLNKANDEVIALEEESRSFPLLWQNIRCPVIVVHGSKDPLVSVDNTIYMQEKMINAQLDITVLEGANHFLIWNKEEEVNKAIDKAISYLSPI